MGSARVYSFGRLAVYKKGEVRLPTQKELWVLLFLWLRPEEDPSRLFPEAKNQRKRLQIAVHHLRSALGEDWVRSRGGRYLAAPLPGVWWDAALFEAACRHLDLAPVRELARALYRGPFAPGAPFERERRGYARKFERLSE